MQCIVDYVVVIVATVCVALENAEWYSTVSVTTAFVQRDLCHPRCVVLVNKSEAN